MRSRNAQTTAKSPVKTILFLCSMSLFSMTSVVAFHARCQIKQCSVRSLSWSTRPKDQRCSISTTARRSANPMATRKEDRSSNSLSDRLFAEELNVLYDSKCNVCKLEMEWLAKRDIKLNKNQPKLKLTDLEAANFNANDPSNGGIDYETGMAAIYAVRANGEVLKGVPAFALAYEQVGLGWLWNVYRIPGVKEVFNWGYDLFAKHRTRLTRGSTLDELVSLHKQKKLTQECNNCVKQ